MYALGLHAPGCTAARRSPRWSSSTSASRSTPSIRDANIAAFQAGCNFGETTEVFAVPYEVKPGADAGRAPTATSPATSRCPAASSPARSWPGCRCSSAPTRSPRPRTSSTSCASTRASASRTFQAEDEIAGIGAALGASFGGAPGGDDDVRPRHRAEVRDHRPRRDARAAAGRRRRAARRAVDGSADQDRAGRPAAGDVRPQRRGAPCRSWRRRSPADCFDAAIEAARIAVKYRTPVILLSDGYLGQRLRALADPRRSTPCRDDPAFATEPNHTADDGDEAFWPYLRDPETLARPWACPAPRPRAPHRRPREGRRSRQHLLRPEPTTT